MKYASPALIALLDRQTFMMADLLTITLQNGTILTYTSWDTNLVMGGVTYSAHDILFQRGSVRNVVGVEVDSMGLTMNLATDLQLNGSSFIGQVRTGVLDGARVKVDKVFMATPGDTSAGAVSMFSGRISSYTFGRSEIEINVVSDLILLNVQLPRNVYQPSCIHTLYDDDMLALGHAAVGCGVLKSAFVVATSVVTGTPTTLNTPLAGTFPDGYFELGYVIMGSGANSGLKRTVKGYTNGTFILASPFPHTVAPGNTFNAFPGCDHLQSTCVNKFNNLAKFRGFPYVPVPETAV